MGTSGPAREVDSIRTEWLAQSHARVNHVHCTASYARRDMWRASNVTVVRCSDECSFTVVAVTWGVSCDWLTHMAYILLGVTHIPLMGVNWSNMLLGEWLPVSRHWNGAVISRKMELHDTSLIPLDTWPDYRLRPDEWLGQVSRGMMEVVNSSR